MLLVLQGLLPGATVYLTKLVLDGAEAAIGQGLAWTSMQPLIVPAALMGLVMLTSRALGSIMQWVQTAQSEQVQDHIQSLIHQQAVNVDLAFYESPQYYDSLHQASTQASRRTLELLGSLGSLLQNGVTLFTIAFILLPYGWWIPVALVLSTLPALYVVARHNRRYHRWWTEATKEQRRAQYFQMLLTYDFSAPEIRLFDLGDHFRGAYDAIREKLRDEKVDLMRQQSIARLGASLIGLLVTAAVMAWMVWRALTGNATIGDLGLFYQSFNKGQGIMRSLLGAMGSIYGSALFLEHLFAFLALEPTVTAPDDPRPVPSELTEGIRFQGVTFYYPGTESPALENFDLFIPAGTVTAIVGPNGAGKSTLLKLLCRLYDPSEGRVEYDGTDIRQFAPGELRQRTTVMFQMPMRYQAAARQNIRVGDLSRSASSGEVEAAAQGALAHEFIETLPRGYDTHLGKWFESGAELSGGQWQRVSLARAFYRQAPIIALDEPTSAMDSWAENAWLQQFGELVAGHTTLLITHRFTTAMHADQIFVMRDSAIVESGTHDTLLEEDGYYAESWRQQVEQGWRATGHNAAPPSLRARGNSVSERSFHVEVPSQSDGHDRRP
jgi:ATP-binding cassette subfamily B protein